MTPSSNDNRSVVPEETTVIVELSGCGNVLRIGVFSEDLEGTSFDFTTILASCCPSTLKFPHHSMDAVDASAAGGQGVNYSHVSAWLAHEV